MYKFYLFLVCWRIFFCSSLYASCCSTSGSSGVGRLASHEYALVQLNNIFSANLGYFDQHGYFLPGTPRHLTYFSYQPQIHILARTTNFLFPYIILGSQINKSAVRIGSGLSDSTAGTRIIILKPDRFKYIPGILLTPQIVFPTGTRAQTNLENRSEYITSMGDYKFNLGSVFEKSFYYINFNLGYNFGFSFDKNQIYKFTHVISLGSGYAPWVLSYVSGSLNLLLGNKNYSQREISLGAAWAQKIHSHIKIILSSNMGLPIAHLSQNTKSQLVTQLNLRFGVF